MSRLIVSSTLFALAFAAPLASAQITTPAGDSALVAPSKRDPIPPPANDSLFRRARRMVSEGNGAAGRALVDSLLAATDPSTPDFGDALYWHGALAPTAAAAEADYRRVIVEYPLAYYSGDALLAIAELEQARGDRLGAMQHLQRFVREHPENPGRGIAALGVARLAFEQRDSTLACSMLVEARRSMSPTDVETRNQVEYYANRCTSTATNAVASAPAPAPSVPESAPSKAPPQAPAPEPTPSRTPAPSSAAANASVTTTKPTPTTSAATREVARTAAKTTTSAPAKEIKREASAPARPTSHARTVTRYTVQVAAYNTRADANALVKRLATRGIKAHVSGTTRPFRVRLALHTARKDANAELASLRKRGIEGFVAEEEVITGARTP